jgi:hypothetical protein
VGRVTEHQVVFALATDEARPGGHSIVIGIPKGAWEYMRDGQTNHFDLASAGVPLRIVLFGAEDHDAVMKAIERGAAEKGIALLDERRRDFAIQGKP